MSFIELIKKIFCCCSELSDDSTTIITPQTSQTPLLGNTDEPSINGSGGLPTASTYQSITTMVQQQQTIVDPHNLDIVIVDLNETEQSVFNVGLESSNRSPSGSVSSTPGSVFNIGLQTPSKGDYSDSGSNPSSPRGVFNVGFYTPSKSESDSSAPPSPYLGSRAKQLEFSSDEEEVLSASI